MPPERPAFIDPSSVTHDQILAVETAYWDTMRRTRDRATDARLLTTGQLAAPIPQELADAVDNVDNFRADLPHKYVEPLAIKQALIGQRPVIKREPKGIGPRALEAATKVDKIVQMMRDAGATEVHMRIASPPTQHSCFYGVDTPERAKLLAAQMSVGQMANFINADSLSFVSIDGLYRALGEAKRADDAPQYCDACFTGDYPTTLTDFDEHGLEDQFSLLAERVV